MKHSNTVTSAISFIYDSMNYYWVSVDVLLIGTNPSEREDWEIFVKSYGNKERINSQTRYNVDESSK